MGSTIGLTVEGMDALRGSLARIKTLGGNPKPALKRFGERMKGWTVDALRNRRDPATGASHKPLSGLSQRLKDEGVRKTRWRLLNSIVSRPAVVTNDSVSIGSNLVYANIQQEGGVVLPKRSKYLAIPVSKQGAKAVYARRFFDQNKTGKNRPFVHKSKRGTLVIATAGKSGFKVHFLLLKKVTVPKRPYLGFPPEAEEKLVGDFGFYADMLAKKGGG